MSEFEVKLSQLRDAAEMMKKCGTRIQNAAQSANYMIDQLAMWGVETTSLTMMGNRAEMEIWGKKITQFATRLTTAVQDVEAAIEMPQYEPLTQLRPFSIRLTDADRKSTQMLFDILDRKEPTRYTIGDYISRNNRAIYDELLRDRDLIEHKQATMVELISLRDRTASDLAALKNRLISYDATIDVENVPRVIAMEHQLSQIDSDINALSQDIGYLNQRVIQITERLDLLTPGAGADLTLIEQLELGETASWVKDNTYDCVRHIAEKMPVPDGIALDAYMWDDRAAELVEYGITSGDQPMVGAVLVLEREHAYADDQFGHLFYVERVENGMVWVTDNDNPLNPVRLSELTDELSGENMKYLYFPWHTRA